MAQRQGIAGFGPLVPPRCKAILLGSYPSPKSFEGGFYYGHARNRFWPLCAALAGTAVPQTIPEKRALILQSRLALWDALESCTIQGASDASIESPVPNDIAGLIRQTGAAVVFCNGSAAYTYYQTLCRPAGGPDAVRLPSTSPANAAYTLPRLVTAWQAVAPYLAPG